MDRNQGVNSSADRRSSYSSSPTFPPPPYTIERTPNQDQPINSAHNPAYPSYPNRTFPLPSIPPRLSLPPSHSHNRNSLALSPARRDEPLPPVPQENTTPRHAATTPNPARTLGTPNPSTMTAHTRTRSTGDTARSGRDWVVATFTSHYRRKRERREHQEQQRLQAEREKQEQEERQREAQRHIQELARRREEEERRRQEEERRRQEAMVKTRSSVFGIVQKMLSTHSGSRTASPMEEMDRCSEMCQAVGIVLPEILQEAFVEDHTPFYWVCLNADKESESESRGSGTSSRDDTVNDGELENDSNGTSSEAHTADAGSSENVSGDSTDDTTSSPSTQSPSSNGPDPSLEYFPPTLKALLTYCPFLTATSKREIFEALRITSNNELLQLFLQYSGFSALSGGEKLILASSLRNGRPARDNASLVRATGNKFSVAITIPEFQKRMRVCKKVVVYFIVDMRIWQLEFNTRILKWAVKLSLLKKSRRVTLTSFGLVCRPQGPHDAPTFRFREAQYPITVPYSPSDTKTQPSSSRSSKSTGVDIEVAYEGLQMPLQAPGPVTSALQNIFPCMLPDPLTLHADGCPYMDEEKTFYVRLDADFQD
ncbi:hypothetical protein FA15DRAFT_159527 [Coprinopsis marcescibilis]|uniref:Uncharacterized protein n=1 Tax=Coprinopsis marcescibilis TaxID=230819 RepID=A0A5C3L3L1_COPMA|nr:hypothetical protein FA15DRAFT_159527 [Coprinopsis marcescibilis]